MGSFESMQACELSNALMVVVLGVNGGDGILRSRAGLLHASLDCGFEWLRRLSLCHLR